MTNFVPITIVIFDISDEKQAAKKVERYCEACLKTVHENDEIKTAEYYGLEIGDVRSIKSGQRV
jgi:hypothetical protein